MNELQCYNCNNPVSEKDFKAADALLRCSLPDNELRSFERQKALLKNPAYHLYILKNNDDTVISVLAAWDFPQIIYGEHFAVDKGLRNGGIGGKIFNAFLTSLEKPLVIEVELPDHDLAARRIKFYERHGLHLNRYNYLQPPMQPQHAPLPLYLMTYPTPLTPTQFEQVKDLLYQHVYGISQE